MWILIVKEFGISKLGNKLKWVCHIIQILRESDKYNKKEVVESSVPT